MVRKGDIPPVVYVIHMNSLTSREDFLKQLERCVKHQKDDIPAESPITAPPEQYIPMGEFIAPELTGNGEEVQTDTASTWGLRPPGEDADPSPTINVYDWGGGGS